MRDRFVRAFFFLLITFAFTPTRTFGFVSGGEQAPTAPLSPSGVVSTPSKSVDVLRRDARGVQTRYPSVAKIVGRSFTKEREDGTQMTPVYYGTGCYAGFGTNIRTLFFRLTPFLIRAKLAASLGLALGNWLFASSLIRRFGVFAICLLFTPARLASTRSLNCPAFGIRPSRLTVASAIITSSLVGLALVGSFAALPTRTRAWFAFRLGFCPTGSNLTPFFIPTRPKLKGTLAPFPLRVEPFARATRSKSPLPATAGFLSF